MRVYDKSFSAQLAQAEHDDKWIRGNVHGFDSREFLDHGSDFRTHVLSLRVNYMVLGFAELVPRCALSDNVATLPIASTA